MQKAKTKVGSQVHVLTQKSSMKFIPKNFVKQKIQPIQTQTSSIVEPSAGRFSFSSLFFRKKNQSASEQTDKHLQRAESLPVNIEQLDLKQLERKVDVPETDRPKVYKLKFIAKLSPQHLLIGNQFQLDAINILGINSNKYVQTQYLWSFSFKDPITHVSIDPKKQNLLTIATGRKLLIYKYDPKKITTDKFTVFKQIVLETVPRFVQVVKDANICIFYENRLQILLVGQQIRSRYNKPYQKPEIVIQQNYAFKLFMVPQPFENILNIFFQSEKTEKDKIFVLWCTQIEFLSSEIKTSVPHKIYDVKRSLKKNLVLKNYSKQIFLMHLGSEIYALKKGYMLDSAAVNLKQQSSLLQYIGNDTLLHISAKKADVYSFTVNLNVKPHRIVIKPKDSIKISQNQSQDQYFKVFNILANDLLLVFQRNSQVCKSKCGQIQYSFYITRITTRQYKMNQLFPINTGQDFKIDDPLLLQKCDMAQKMGFTTKQIFLQLWNRSQQSRKQDFSILIATKDYTAINQQIIRKLKKASMNFKQIHNIEQACFAMLHEKIFSASCTEEAVMDYIASHFFKRKLEMFRDIQMMQKLEKIQKQKDEPQQRETFKMTIRQYHQYKSMEIKQELLSLVNQFCHEGKKHLSKNIRFLLRNFKFVFRMIYYELLQAIIKNANTKLLELLQQIPELLPYYPPQRQSSLHIPSGFYEGVWPEISKQEWETSLYTSAITTIDNKQIIMEKVIKNINFKRNWLSQHDVVQQPKQKIQEQYDKIKSPFTFYLFAAKIFQYINDRDVLKQIVNFLQATYQLPENLKGTIFLNQRLYMFFIQRGIAPQINGRSYSLAQFFSFEDKQLVRHLFDKQRSNKGLLLKDIKDIYKQILNEQANQKYNKALLNYFISDLSQVSDLKYILNRINNQKLQFHQQNQSMYQILVEALQRKLKIGTDNDIPIQQVLIYIQNIPLDENSTPLKQLKSVQKIDKDSQRLRAAKVNMSIYDILHNPQQVFTKLVSHIVEEAPPQIWENDKQFDSFAIKKLAELEIFGQDIYETNYNMQIFFIFLAKLCEKTQRIKFADYLLKNQQFKQRINQNTAQGLVLYMQKWKLSSSKQFIANETYIKQLLKILPQSSNIYSYILSQFQFAKILSAPNKPVTYPISQSYITAADVRDIIYDLPADFVLQLNIQKLHLEIYNMQQVLMNDMKQMEQECPQQEMISPANRITLHQVYQFVIIKLLNSNKMKQVLPIIGQILKINISDTTYNIVYLIMFIIHISNQLNEQNKNNLVQCISHYFYHPTELLGILDYILNNPLSTYQIKKYIEDQLEAGKKLYKGFNQDNPVFDQDYIAVLDDVETEANFMITLNKTSRHMQQTKQQFKNVKYAAIMIMLCNSPYALAKYISCRYKDQVNVKAIRSFLSYAIKQNVFKPFNVLQLGRRIFFVLLQSIKMKQPIQCVIQNYQQLGLDSDTDVEGYQPPKDKNTFEYLMWKSAEAFKKKKMALQAEMRKTGGSPAESVIEKSVRLKSQLGQAPNLQKKNPFDYPFPEIDSDNQIQDLIEIDEAKRKKDNKEVPKFDPSQQMKNFLASQKKPHKLFLSTRGQITNKNMNSLSISIRQQPYKSSNIPNLYDSGREVKKPLVVRQIQQSEPNIQDKSQFNTPRQGLKRSQMRHSADSSPQIRHSRIVTQDRVVEESRFNKLDKLQSYAGEQVNKSQEIEQKSQGSHANYAIKVKQVYDEDELAQMNKDIHDLDEPGIMAESAEFVNPESSKQISKNLIQANKQALSNPMTDYNISQLTKYEDSRTIIVDVIKHLYQDYSSLPNFQRVMKMIGEIVNRFPICQINPQIFNLIIKAQQAQAKTIPQIKFVDLLSESALVTDYPSKRHVFDKIYQNLSQYVDSQNIYKITQFIRRVFDNAQYEQEVTWDFILQLCDKLQFSQEQEINWNIQKIQANISKVSIGVWLRKFENFEVKVLLSPFKDQLLQVFCKHLKTKKKNDEAIEFLSKVKELGEYAAVNQTLQMIK